MEINGNIIFQNNVVLNENSGEGKKTMYKQRK